MKKLIVTGFDAFGKHSENPTEIAINFIAKNFDPNIVHPLVLPTSYERSWKALKEAIEKFRPDRILMFGLAHRAEDFQIEKVAINYRSATIADNDNIMAHDEKILETAEDGLFATIPIQDFRDNCGGELSLSAGSYVCNNLMFQCLKYTQNSSVDAGFIHIPGEAKSQSQINEFVENVINFAIN